MRIAFIGVKGLPGTFSGIETHVHELGSRLANRGHDVVAYVRPHYTPRNVVEDEGIRLIHRPTIPTKHLDASVHSFLSSIHTITKNYDVVHFHAIGPAAFAPISQLSGAKIVTTIHRFDYQSGKWGWFARTCLQAAESVSLRSSDRTIVIAAWLREHYREKGFDVDFIPNGVPLPDPDLGSDQLAQFNLNPGDYYLFLGRLVPEKRPDWAIRAFAEACGNSDRRLVITGGSSATDKYIASLKKAAEPMGDRVLFTGPVYGNSKDQLLANARGFLLPSALEGLPITLLEAMSHTRPCLVSAIPPHLDVIADGQNGFLHSADDLDDLKTKLNELDMMDDAKLAVVGRAARQTVAEDFNWEDIVNATEALYSRLTGAG